MLEFHPLTETTLPELRPFLSQNPYRLCDQTVGSIVIWRDYYKTEYAIHEGILYFKVDSHSYGSMFTIPHGGDRKEGYRQIQEYCRRRDMPLIFYPVPGEELEPLRRHFPCTRTFSDRDTFDYLYRSEDLKYFKGKKLGGQRNHVNRFLRTYENWSFGPLTREDVPEVEAFLERYAAATQKDSGSFQEDLRKNREVLADFASYGMVGGVLRVNGQVVAFAIGEVVGDTLFVHIEKADRSYEGCYQMVVSQFAQAFAGEGVDFINREDDTGDPGLRTSKLAYHPVALLEKYAVQVVEQEPCPCQAETVQPASIANGADAQ